MVIDIIIDTSEDANMENQGLCKVQNVYKKTSISR
jgi:hypothetical protein